LERNGHGLFEISFTIPLFRLRETSKLVLGDPVNQPRFELRIIRIKIYIVSLPQLSSGWNPCYRIQRFINTISKCHHWTLSQPLQSSQAHNPFP